MVDEHTPTTDQVRAAWAYFRNVSQGDATQPEALAQFDRWFAAYTTRTEVDVMALAQALSKVSFYVKIDSRQAGRIVQVGQKANGALS